MADSQKFEDLQARAAKAEAEVAALFQRLEKFQSKSAGKAADGEPVGQDEETERLEVENRKLQYRIGILQRAVEDLSQVPQPSTDGMVNILAELERLFDGAVAAAFPDLTDRPPVVVQTADPRHGDYQYNGAMEVCKLLSAKGPKRNPREVAAAVIAAVPPHPAVAKLQLAGAFFVNVTLDRDFLGRQLALLVALGVRPPAGIQKKKVVIDYSSPNIAKEMHVGHLRSTIIGDSLSRTLEFMGHELVRVNHIGDWGTQFGMLLAHLEDRFPHFATETPPIGDLQAFYKESKVRFDSDAEFKARAYACVVRLQSRDPVYIRGWQAICDVSRREFQKIYERLEIHEGLMERGESFYQERMEETVRVLQAAGRLQDDEGRKVMFSDEHSVPLTVVKSDGGFTYDTSDLATIRHRIDEERGQWLIYVTDAGQAPHLETIFACARMMGWWRPEEVRVDHVAFGVVLGEDRKKFKSRSSDTVRLVDLLDEGLRRARDKIEDREKAKAAEGKDLLTEEEKAAAGRSIAYGCIKYADLSHNRNAEYVFSFDKMLDDKGNTAVYLLYAYTRIRSIGRTAGVDGQQLRNYVGEGDRPVRLEHDKEVKLAKTLLRLPEVLRRVAAELCLHNLCEYLYDISTTFTEFYQVCYCVEKDRATDAIVKVHLDRLALCEATALVMARCFDQLGLHPVERM